MMGDQSNPGVIPIAIKHIFTHISQVFLSYYVLMFLNFFLIQSKTREYIVRASYLEIYNETVRDLFSPSSAHLKIHEDIEVSIIDYLYCYFMKNLNFREVFTFLPKKSWLIALNKF